MEESSPEVESTNLPESEAADLSPEPARFELAARPRLETVMLLAAIAVCIGVLASSVDMNIHNFAYKAVSSSMISEKDGKLVRFEGNVHEPCLVSFPKEAEACRAQALPVIACWLGLLFACFKVKKGWIRFPVVVLLLALSFYLSWIGTRPGVIAEHLKQVQSGALK